MRFLVLLISLTAAAVLPVLPAQSDTILLHNPSFEGLPRHSYVPKNWRDCGPKGESPPDLHPTGAFGVRQTPAHGQSYLGMVVRDNDTRESVGQPLDRPLRAGQCYRFTVFACRSDQYLSMSRMTRQMADYTRPVVLQVWGTDGGACPRNELLAVSGKIEHRTWQAYTFFFRPEREHAGIVLEAAHAPDQIAPYNGNVLLDFAGPIVPIDCSEAERGLFPPDLLPTPSDLGLPPAPPLPTNRAELEAAIRKLAPSVAFLQTWPAPEHWVYQEEPGTGNIDNYYLRLIVSVLAAVPTATLVIGINEKEHVADHDQLAAGLRAELERLDAPDRILIREIRNRDRKQEWLVKGGRLWWRVE